MIVKFVSYRKRTQTLWTARRALFEAAPLESVMWFLQRWTTTSQVRTTNAPNTFMEY